MITRGVRFMNIFPGPGACQPQVYTSQSHEYRPERSLRSSLFQRLFLNSYVTIRYIHRQLKDREVSLRPFRVFDVLSLHSGFSSEDFAAAHGLSKPIALSWFPLWWWIKKTFVFSYCIVINSRRAGFIGLHTLRPGESAELSLALFEEQMRRKGYGSRAFHLFAHTLEKQSLIKMLLVRVRQDNFAALSFWKKLGFAEMRKEDAVIVLFYTLRPSQTIPVAESPAYVQPS